MTLVNVYEVVLKVTYPLKEGEDRPMVRYPFYRIAAKEVEVAEEQAKTLWTDLPGYNFEISTHSTNLITTAYVI